MQLVDVAWIECLENRDETIGGNIILDHEGGQPNQADIVDGKRPQRIAIETGPRNVAKKRLNVSSARKRTGCLRVTPASVALFRAIGDAPEKTGMPG
jgi:hypothetical protein